MTEITDEWGITDKFVSDEPKYRHYYDTALGAFKDSLAIFDSEDYRNKTGFKLETQDSETGDKIYSKSFPKIGKTFFAVGTFEATPEAMFEDAHDLENVPKWNPNILEYFKVLDVSTYGSVIYNRLPDMFTIVKSRDFVDARISRKLGDTYYIAGINVECDKMPPVKGKVRGANGPCLMRFSPIPDKPGCCAVDWKMNVDLKGMIPKAIVDKVMHHNMMEYLKYWREHLKKR